MANESELIAVCPNHQDEKVSPLISTCVFPGAEYWCPYCGAKFGYFDVKTETASEQMKQLLEEYTEQTADFLNAFHLVRGGRKRINGQTATIDVFSEAEQERLIKIVREFKYESK